MYFVNSTNSSSEDDGREGCVVADCPNAAAAPARSIYSRGSSPPTAVTESDVPGLTLHHLKADGLLWAVYERGWKDAYAAARAAFAVHPSTPFAVTPPSPTPQPSKTPPPPPPSPPSPNTNTRSTTNGPVRHRARADRHARRKKVPSHPVQNSPGKSSGISTTEIKQYEEEETYKKNCYDWVNSLEIIGQCGPEDIICPGSDIGSCSTIPQTPEEVEDAMWQPWQNPCFQNYTTAETTAYKSAWLHIPSVDCCEHCVLKTY